MQRGAPGGDEPVAYHDKRNEKHRLSRQSPVGIAHESHHDTDAIGHDNRKESYQIDLLELQMSVEICTLYRSERVYDKAAEEEPRQRCEALVVVESGDVWRCEPQEQIQDRADKDVKPKHGVVLLVRRFLLVYQRRRQSAVLQVGGYVGIYE